MKYIIITVTALLAYNANAQNNIKTILTGYSNHNISFESPTIKEYSEKYAQVYHDMCLEMLSGDEVQSKLDALSIAYSNDFKTISKKDKASLDKICNLLSSDCNNYSEKRNLVRAKAWVKAELREQNKDLYEEVENAQISFESMPFGQFAVEMEHLVFEKCSTGMSHEEYDSKAKQIKQKYAEDLKLVSEKDLDALALLYKIVHVRCTNFDIEKQYGGI